MLKVKVLRKREFFVTHHQHQNDAFSGSDNNSDKQ